MLLNISTVPLTLIVDWQMLNQKKEHLIINESLCQANLKEGGMIMKQIIFS